MVHAATTRSSSLSHLLWRTQFSASGPDFRRRDVAWPMPLIIFLWNQDCRVSSIDPCVETRRGCKDTFSCDYIYRSSTTGLPENFVWSKQIVWSKVIQYLEDIKDSALNPHWPVSPCGMLVVCARTLPKILDSFRAFGRFGSRQGYCLTLNPQPNNLTIYGIQ